MQSPPPPSSPALHPPDPRETITPERFAIDPSLLGLPLARPMRRAAAMLLDLLIIALLVHAGSVFFGLAAAWVCFRVGGRSAGGGFLRRSWRFTFRSAAAVVLFSVVVSQWGAVRGVVLRDGRQPAERTSASGERVGEEVDAALRVAAGSVALRGMDVGGASPDVGGDTLAVLHGRLREAAAEQERLRAQLRDAREERGILAFLWQAADDLGLTFGWSGLYFTAFLALWQGQTPGKRLLRIRVLRLDGKPMTWWASFERFGGYAASLFTGLLGFAQIVWDRNRQGMHDKITETVVVRL